MAGILTTLEGKRAESYTGDTVSSGFVYDLYASVLNYKKTITNFLRQAVSISWVPANHRRRLKAYELFHSYWDNYSRDFRNAPEVGSDNYNSELDEQGDCFWFCEKLKNKLLGESLTLSLPVPAKYGDGEFFNTLLLDETIESGLKNLLMEKQKQLAITSRICMLRERYLQWWFGDENIYNIINMNESKCSALGDCVYMVGWNSERKTVELKTYDPAYCFPYKFNTPVESFDTNSKEGVTERFVLAWEEEIDSQEYFLVYREIYEKRLSGKIFRQKGYFKYSGGSNISIENIEDKDMIDGSNPVWEDIKLDFIPYVWIPNIAREGEEPYGISNIAHVIDLIDKIINCETDLAINSDYLGGAIVGLSGEGIRLRKETGGTLVSIPIKPRTAFVLGKDGKMDLIDTSQMQTALLSTLKYQTSKLLKILDMPDVAVGNAEGRAVQLSGLALRILLQPLIDRLNPIRADRQKRYSTLFYYIQRLFALYGDEYEKFVFTGELFDVKLIFGEIVPMNETEEIEKLNAMKGLFSRKVILEKAKEKGIVTFDIISELANLKEEEESQAAQLTSAFQFRAVEDQQTQ